MGGDCRRPGAPAVAAIINTEADDSQRDLLMSAIDLLQCSSSQALNAALTPSYKINPGFSPLLTGPSNINPLALSVNLTNKGRNDR